MKKLILLLSIVFVTVTGFGQATGKDFANYPTSGSIGTAAATVDANSRINIIQTTPSITLTVPPPTNTSTKVVEVWIGNKGTVSFTLRALPDIDGFVVDTGQAVILKWIGAKYVVIGKAPASVSIIAEAPLSYINDTLKLDTTKVPYFSGGISGPKNSSTYLNGVGVWDTINTGGVVSVTGTTNRITSTGGSTPVIDIDASYVGQSSITTLGTIGTGVWNAGAVTSSGSIIGLNFQATGSGSNGYLRLPFQTATPTAVSGSMIIYSDGSNRFSTVRRNNANSADITRTHIYPDASYSWTFPTPASGSTSTLPGLETAQTWTQTNIFTAAGTLLQSVQLWNGSIYASAIDNLAGFRVGSGFTSLALGGSASTISMGANNSSVSLNASTLNFTSSNAATLVGYQNDISLITRDNIARAYKVFIRTGDLNNSATVSSGDVVTRSGNVANTGATSSTSSGNLIYDVGTVKGSALRGNWQLFGGLTSVGWNSGQRIMFIGNRTASPIGNPTAGYYMWGESGDATIRSSGGGITSVGTAGVSMQTVGQGLLIKEGTNATLGRATMVGGTITVNTTKVTANSEIFLTIQSPSGTPGAVYVSDRTAGTSFTITSTTTLDTSVVAWFIVEPN